MTEQAFSSVWGLSCLRINPYGRFEVDLNKRIDFKSMAA